MTMNARFYNVSNKNVAAKKLLNDTELRMNKSETTKNKTKNKLAAMINSDKKIKTKTSLNKMLTM
jgi:hypothetical protein